MLSGPVWLQQICKLPGVGRIKKNREQKSENINDYWSKKELLIKSGATDLSRTSNLGQAFHWWMDPHTVIKISDWV